MSILMLIYSHNDCKDYFLTFLKCKMKWTNKKAENIIIQIKSTYQPRQIYFINSNYLQSVSATVVSVPFLCTAPIIPYGNTNSNCFVCFFSCIPSDVQRNFIPNSQNDFYRELLLNEKKKNITIGQLKTTNEKNIYLNAIRFLFISESIKFK